MNEPLSLIFAPENKALLNVLDVLEGWVRIISMRNVLHGEICHAMHVSSGILWYNITTFHIFRF